MDNQFGNGFPGGPGPGYRIVQEPAGIIRAVARNDLRGYWLQVAGVMFLFQLLTTGIVGFFDTFINFGTVRVDPSQMPYQVDTAQETVSMLSFFYVILVAVIFVYGQSLFMIRFFREKDTNPGHLFDGFSYYGSMLLLAWSVVIRIMLWSLLLVVPGVIAAYRYSQAFYILADDPRKSPHQCIEESKQMTMGNKMALFLLDLSFIGWIILAQIPAGVLGSLFAAQGITGKVPLFVIQIVGLIPTCFLASYMQEAQVVFYDIMTGRLVTRAEPFGGGFEEPR